MDEDLLDMYLKSRIYSISPVHDGEEIPTKSLGISQLEESGTETSSYDGSIITEVVSQHLQSGVIGYYTNVKMNPEYKGARKRPTKVGL